jgi:hypothetical protein
MNYINNFYCKFKEFLNPGYPIKSNYVPKNNYLIKNAILKPIFKDEFNVEKQIKYNNLFQPISIISPLANPICIQLKNSY